MEDGNSSHPFGWDLLAMFKMKTQTIIIVVLFLLLVISLSYIGITKYKQKQSALYQNGLQDGYREAVTRIFQQATTCNQVPITYNDTTIHIVSVECLRGGKQ